MHSESKRERLQEFEDLCRRQGLPLTVQRRTILEAILAREDHPTAEQVYDAVRGTLPGVSRTTVYRVLDTLVDVGLITRACSRSATTRFDPVTDRHHHLVCTHCQKLIDVEDGQFSHRVELPDVRACAFEIHDFSIQFSGICAACRKKLGSQGAVRKQKEKPAGGRATTRETTKKRRSQGTER